MSTLAPRLRHRIAFQEQVHSKDSEGALTTTWEDVELGDGTVLDSVPAEVLTGPGREALMSGQMNADIAARITVRWFPDLKQSWRIVWDGRIFNIQSIESDMTGRREWRIKCTAGLNDGQ